MKINNKEININDLISSVNNDSKMLKMRGYGIYLSDEEVEVLKKYSIDYKKYTSLSSLIFEIEEILNMNSELDDLEMISKRLAEMNYYNNTNK